MWLFLRASGRSSLSAFLGAFAWEILPKTFAHFGAGHLTLIYAISWTPWLLLAELKSQCHHSRGARLLFTGLILGLMGLADLRWAVYAGLIWAAFSFYQSFHQTRQLPESLPARRVTQWMQFIWDGLRPVTSSLGLAGLIVAPLLLPLLEYTGLSTRSSLNLMDNLSYSLQPLHLFGLVAPAFQGMAEWVIYPGSAALIGIGWVISRPRLRRASSFWLGVILFSLVFALGSSIPWLSFLYQLPGLNLLRVPTRMLIWFGFGCAVILCQMSDSLETNEADEQRHFWVNLFLFGLCVFPWVILFGLWFLSREINLAYLWGATFLSGNALVFIARRQRLISQNFFQMVLMVGVLLDLGVVSQSQFVYRNPDEIINVQGDVASWLASQTGYFRVYSPSYSLPQQTAAILGLNLADGIDPLQLKTYVKTMESATGIPDSEYSVTLPPYFNGDPWVSNINYLPSASRLGLFNVRFVVTEYPLAAAGLLLSAKIGKSTIYENQWSLPRTWVQDITAEVGVNVKPVAILEFAPNRIHLTGSGPGLLVLSEIIYPGWHVYVDGSERPIQQPLGILRGVVLEAGEHNIVFSFQPVSISFGLSLAVLGWFWFCYQGLSLLRNVP